VTSEITVWGEPRSSSLAKREDFAKYSLSVEWSAEDRWRGTQIVLPDGRAVAVDQYVGDNFQTPRQFHPEYALAIELLVANAVMAAKERGFRVAAVELGAWAYLTFTELGQRVTKIGLPEEQLGLDGRTKSRTGYMWIDHESEGVMLVPWAAGDQLIRLKDDRGHYVVPVDERTADATKLYVAQSWPNVQRYKQLGYEAEHEWCDVPLLESADEMLVQHECQRCLFMFGVGTLRKEPRSRMRVCQACKEIIQRERANAKAQGWDYDKKIRFPRPAAPPPSSLVLMPGRGKDKLIREFNCAVGDHAWGMQMVGTSNAALSDEALARGEGQRIRRCCILCDEPYPRRKRFH